MNGKIFWSVHMISSYMLGYDDSNYNYVCFEYKTFVVCIMIKICKYNRQNKVPVRRFFLALVPHQIFEVAVKHLLCGDKQASEAFQLHPALISSVNRLGPIVYPCRTPLVKQSLSQH